MQTSLQTALPRHTETTLLASSARSFLQDDQSDQAELVWRELLRREPDNNEALFGVAEQLCAAGHSVNALVYLNRATNSGSNDALALKLVWRVLSDLSGTQMTTGSHSAEQMADSVVQLLKEMDTNILWPSARKTIARLLVRTGVDARLIQSEPGSEQSAELHGVCEPEVLLARFRESRDEGVLPETISSAIERLAKAETDAEAWFVLGRDSMGRDETETAQELFRRAAFLEPGRIKYRINLARALGANAEYAQAYEAFHSVTSLVADSRADNFHLEEASVSRRSLLSRLILLVRKAIAEGDDAGAWSLYQLIAWEPDLADGDGMRSAILRLSIDQVMKAHKLADPEVIPLARRHLERDPESVYVRQVLGQALMTAERFREAAELWGSLTVSLPENARMFLQYAKCLERSGAGEAALEAAEQALRIDPSLDSAQIIFNRLTN